MHVTERIFRVFVSSTFSDLKIERNALHQHVFPKLKELCLLHGCRFQAVDLRWGVRDEAALDQQTLPICLGEIARCQRVTPRPNFLVLLGDRYGWRPLPAEIPAAEFEQIERRIGDFADKTLLRLWYRRDDNAAPAIYYLRPRTGAYADHSTWEERVERPLRTVLCRAIDQLGWPEHDTRRIKYEASATEQEIVRGALQVTDAAEHVFGFIRTIECLPLDYRAKDFVDLGPTGRPDEDAAARLQYLKGRLRCYLPGNVHEFTAAWTGSGVTTDHIGLLPEALEDCLKLNEACTVPANLCIHVWRALSRLLLNEIARIEQLDALDQERSAHEMFEREKVRFFVGRTSILQAIADYLSASDRHTLAVYGPSGSGKSAVLAKAAQQARVAQPHAEVILRFVGATPNASDCRALFQAICRDISRRYGAAEMTDSVEHQDLRSRLAVATPDRPLILFLDGVDQLYEEDRNLALLPSELPDNVRVMISTLPGDCLAAVESKVPPANRMELEGMSLLEGNDLLKRWLTDAGRALQPKQREEVLSKFARNGSPLYLRLAFDEARRWKSDNLAMRLPDDVAGVVRELFRRLAVDHGQLMVSRSLGWLAAARAGLTEVELLDLLVWDGEFFADFKAHAHHDLPELDLQRRQLPDIVWSRLRYDLDPYLIERGSRESPRLTFYHSQIREEAVVSLLERRDHWPPHPVEPLAGLDHLEWVRQRVAEGWRYGASRDNLCKTHPFLLAYEDLPAFGRMMARGEAVESLTTMLALKSRAGGC